MNFKDTGSLKMSSKVLVVVSGRLFGLWPKFQKNIQLKVGNGVKIEFWNELWIGERNLKSLFPDLFLLSQQTRARPLEANLESQSPFKSFLFCVDAKINSHLFLHCKTVANLWNVFFCILGVSWVVPKTTKSMMYWKEIERRDSAEDWWELIPTSIWWTLLGVSWVMPKTAMELLNSWTRIGNRGKREDWWKAIPACIWWTP
ncbi:hypothetical protein H5410_009867 [Solanum commersonii]|uniref:Reverse transcriptase zinc-binding domain-containing protein n=1 Tax=Solanum commersonii TaxID=4109 RepID=A0A9J6AJM8_SOLCO|nr:hypothetical protein H5410_009867 [Solanum commersonii]